jgi:hypothetical protein
LLAALELAKRCAGLLPVHITLVSNQSSGAGLETVTYGSVLTRRIREERAVVKRLNHENHNPDG